MWDVSEWDSPTRYVDVDNTLLLWPEGKKGQYAPPVNYELISNLRTWKTKNNRLFIWSYGGVPYSKQAAEYCGISDIVDGYMNKPTEMFDDDFWHMEKTVRRHVVRV